MAPDVVEGDAGVAGLMIHAQQDAGLVTVHLRLAVIAEPLLTVRVVCADTRTVGADGLAAGETIGPDPAPRVGVRGTKQPPSTTLHGESSGLLAVEAFRDVF